MLVSNKKTQSQWIHLELTCQSVLLEVEFLTIGLLFLYCFRRVFVGRVDNKAVIEADKVMIGGSLHSPLPPGKILIVITNSISYGSASISKPCKSFARLTLYSFFYCMFTFQMEAVSVHQVLKTTSQMSWVVQGLTIIQVRF